MTLHYKFVKFDHWANVSQVCLNAKTINLLRPSMLLIGFPMFHLMRFKRSLKAVIVKLQLKIQFIFHQC